jgi:hypothetical protein
MGVGGHECGRARLRRGAADGTGLGGAVARGRSGPVRQRQVRGEVGPETSSGLDRPGRGSGNVVRVSGREVVSGYGRGD